MSLKKRVSQLSPLKQAFLKLKEMQAQLDAIERSKSEPIAIIGMGCRLPGGVKDAESYWQFLKNGREAIREVPPDRWDMMPIMTLILMCRAKCIRGTVAFCKTQLAASPTY